MNNFPPSCQGCGDCRFFIAGMLFDGCVEEVNLRVRFFWVIVVGLINLFSKVLYLICQVVEVWSLWPALRLAFRAGGHLLLFLTNRRRVEC